MSWFGLRNTRKQKQQAIQQLRQQKQPIFSGFAPSKAYIISGHGNEGTGTFRVPKDVIIIAKMQPHKTMLSTMAEKLSAKVICKPEIYKDPLAYMDIVIQELGDLAVYREGDLCPNFQYSLWSDDSTKRNNKTTTVINKSGLLDIDTLQCGSGIQIVETTFNYDEDTIHKLDIQEQILNIFKESILPTQQALISSFSSGRLQTFRDWYVYYRDYLFSTTQEKLAKNPGVYYNFVCRYSKISASNAVNYTKKKISNEEQQHIFQQIQTNPRLQELIQQYTIANDQDELNRLKTEIGDLTRSLTSDYLGLSETPVGSKYLTKESAYSNFASAPLRNKKKALLNRIAEAETIRKRAMYYAQHPENVEGHRLAKEANMVRRVKREARLKPLWNRMAEKQSKPKWYQFWKGKTMKQVRPLDTSTTTKSAQNWVAPQPAKKPWYKFWGGRTRRNRH